MDGVKLLKQARLAGISVELHDGRLAIKGPKSATAIVKELLQAKAEVLAALTPAAEPAVAQQSVVTGTTPSGGEESRMPQAASVPCDPRWTPCQQNLRTVRFGDNSQWPTTDNPARVVLLGKPYYVAMIFAKWFCQLAGHPEEGWTRCRHWKRLIEEQLKFANDDHCGGHQPESTTC